MKADLEKKTKKLSDREVSIQQLNTICKKFETQLKQQVRANYDKVKNLFQGVYIVLTNIGPMQI